MVIQQQFAIHFPDFFREPMTKWVTAKTVGEAKYKCYLQFRDAYDMDFIDFLKIVKVWKFKNIDSTESARAD